jgi:hypothetical protein
VKIPGDTPEPPGLRPGQSWGVEESGPPDLEVSGTDATLGAVLARGVEDPLVRFVPGPGSDLARAVGLVAGAAPGGMALPADVLAVTINAAEDRLAVNSVVVGVAPDRLRAWHRPARLSVEIDGSSVEAAAATTLVIMNGQYLRGLDVSPRGHPGDGVAEAQLYALPPAARRPMRARLATGAHLPHPAITIRRVHRLEVRSSRPFRLEIDATPAGEATRLELTVRATAYRLLV